MKKANTIYLNTNSNVAFVNLFYPMIDLTGKPCENWFLEDSLHMADKGYQLWSKILAPYLK